MLTLHFLHEKIPWLVLFCKVSQGMIDFVYFTFIISESKIAVLQT